MFCRESRARRSGSLRVCSTPSRGGAAWSTNGASAGTKTSPRDTSVETRPRTPTSRTGCASRRSRLITCMSRLRLSVGIGRGSARGSALLELVRVVQQAQQNRRRTTTSTRTWRRDKPNGTRPRTCCAGAGSSAARTTPSTRRSTTSGRVGGACGCRRGRKEFCHFRVRVPVCASMASRESVQAQASYVAGFPVPLRLPPGPPVRLELALVLVCRYARPTFLLEPIHRQVRVRRP